MIVLNARRGMGLADGPQLGNKVLHLDLPRNAFSERLHDDERMEFERSRQRCGRRQISATEMEQFQQFRMFLEQKQEKLTASRLSAMSSHERATRQEMDSGSAER